MTALPALPAAPTPPGSPDDGGIGGDASAGAPASPEAAAIAESSIGGGRAGEHTTRRHRRFLAVTAGSYGVVLLAALAMRHAALGSWTYTADLRLPALGPLAAGAGLAFVLIGTRGLIVRWHWVRRVAAIVQEAFGRIGWGWCIVIAVASGVAEEAAFRGAVLPWLERITESATAAVIVSSLIFGALHLMAGWFFYAFGVGLALGALYAWSGNLWPPVAAHVLVNLFNLKALARLGLAPEERQALLAPPARGELLPASHSGRHRPRRRRRLRLWRHRR